FYRIKKEEEENRRNKKEITTKFDEEPDFSFSFLIFSLFLDKRKIIRLISYEKYFLKRHFS
ncbi:hypothetical protein AAH076_17080, partial [Bacteroides xylanisolvens]|uniref:hypothetical protein n=1 Tax=Bacteroides xylanisolvens TaxID=371601 RepID=UPI0039B6193C